MNLTLSIPTLINSPRRILFCEEKWRTQVMLMKVADNKLVLSQICLFLNMILQIFHLWSYFRINLIWQIIIFNYKINVKPITHCWSFLWWRYSCKWWWWWWCSSRRSNKRFVGFQSAADRLEQSLFVLDQTDQGYLLHSITINIITIIVVVISNISNIIIAVLLIVIVSILIIIHTNMLYIKQ